MSGGYLRTLAARAAGLDPDVPVPQPYLPPDLDFAGPARRAAAEPVDGAVGEGEVGDDGTRVSETADMRRAPGLETSAPLARSAESAPGRPVPSPRRVTGTATAAPAAGSAPAAARYDEHLGPPPDSPAPGTIPPRDDRPARARRATPGRPALPEPGGEPRGAGESAGPPARRPPAVPPTVAPLTVAPPSPGPLVAGVPGAGADAAPRRRPSLVPSPEAQDALPQVRPAARGQSRSGAGARREATEITVHIGRIELHREAEPERRPESRPSPPAGFAGLELARRHLDRRWY